MIYAHFSTGSPSFNCAQTQLIAYCRGAPSDQFLRIQYGGPLRSVSSHRIWGPPQISFFTYYGGLLMSFFFVLYGGPSDHFFAYYIEAPRSLSSLTIVGAPLRSVSLFAKWAPPPQISFFACYRGSTSDFIFFTKYMGAHEISFCAYYMGDPSC